MEINSWLARALVAMAFLAPIASTQPAGAQIALAPAIDAHSTGSTGGDSVPALPPGAQALGSLPQSTTVQAVVALRPVDDLAAYAAEVSTPGSSLYHQYLTVPEFAQRFAPTPVQVAAVSSQLQAEGVQTGPVSANGLEIPVTAPAGTIESAFSTSLESYQLPSGQDVYSNTIAPTVDASIASLVQAVVGLDSTPPTPQSAQLAAPAVGQGRTANAQGGSGGGPQPCAAAKSEAARDQSYTADELASTYGFSGLYRGGDLGSGATVGLYELEPFSASDIAAYQSCYGTSASVSTVSVDGGAGTGSGSGEAALDIEDVIGFAPAAKVEVYEGPDNGSGAYATYVQMIADDSAQVIATSWGACESEVGTGQAQAEDTLFQEAATQGQSIFAASGDSGSDDCSDGSQAVDDPASQPWVTGVGASSLGGSDESVWDNEAGASGGGVSTLWTRPSYQSGVSPAQSLVGCGVAGAACREVPDVSIDGDPDTGYVTYYRGGWETQGGTSAAAPAWAALAALADASATCSGHAIGFANPALYAVSADDYSANFNDITSGGNGYGGVGGFAAGPGYDLASGLGTPHAASLAPAVCGDTVAISQPSAQRTAAGARPSLQLSATSSTGRALTFSAADLPPGLTISSSGRISGSPTTGGVHEVVATATDASGSSAKARFAWSVTGNVTATASAAGPIILDKLSAQLGRVGRAERLRVRARDLRGSKLSYRASGLPAGLSIGRQTGSISGIPRRVSRRAVSITASDSRGGHSSTRFVWVIAGPPRVTAASVRRLAGGGGRLSLSLSPGRNAPAIARVVVSAPAGTVTFSPIAQQLAKTIVASPRADRQVKIGSRLRRGSLTLFLAHAVASQAELRLTGIPVRLGHRLAGRLTGSRARSLRLAIVVYATDGVRTKLTAGL